MPRYFDPDRTVDLDLLPMESQDASDLNYFATEAEADVIAYFTRDLTSTGTTLWPTVRAPLAEAPVYTAVGDHLGVFLRFYTVNPDDVDTAAADGAAFLLAMKRTIAAVVGWRILQSKMNTLAIQETREGRHLIKSMLQIEPYPPNWTRWLEPFSTLPPVWTL